MANKKLLLIFLCFKYHPVLNMCSPYVSVLLVDRSQLCKHSTSLKNSQTGIRYQANYTLKCGISMQFNGIIITISCLPRGFMLRPEATALVDLL